MSTEMIEFKTVQEAQLLHEAPAGCSPITAERKSPVIQGHLGWPKHDPRSPHPVYGHYPAGQVVRQIDKYEKPPITYWVAERNLSTKEVEDDHDGGHYVTRDICWVRPATEEEAQEIAAYDAASEKYNAAKRALLRGPVDWDAKPDKIEALPAGDRHNLISYPSGYEDYVIRSDGADWLAIYNGRNGDDWSHSNYQNYILVPLRSRGLLDDFLAASKALKSIRGLSD